MTENVQLNFIKTDGPEMMQLVDQLTERMFKVVREEEKPDNILNAKEAAKKLKISTKKLRPFLEEHPEIKWKPLGREIRVSEKSIDKWMNS